MHKLPIIPMDETRKSREFQAVRQAISKIALYESTFCSEEEARLAVDEFAEAWLQYRNTPVAELTY